MLTTLAQSLTLVCLIPFQSLRWSLLSSTSGVHTSIPCFAVSTYAKVRSILQHVASPRHACGALIYCALCSLFQLLSLVCDHRRRKNRPVCIKSRLNHVFYLQLQPSYSSVDVSSEQMENLRLMALGARWCLDRAHIPFSGPRAAGCG